MRSLSFCLRAPTLTMAMAAMGRGREYADRYSGHSREVRPGVPPHQLLNVSCIFRTGRPRDSWPAASVTAMKSTP
jgi:hypothetical protein